MKRRAAEQKSTAVRKARSIFRIGQRVQTIHDASRTFVIDRSMVPERIFHEKGSNRWWTKSELQAAGAAGVGQEVVEHSASVERGVALAMSASTPP